MSVGASIAVEEPQVKALELRGAVTELFMMKRWMFSWRLFFGQSKLEFFSEALSRKQDTYIGYSTIYTRCRKGNNHDFQIVFKSYTPGYHPQGMQSFTGKEVYSTDVYIYIYI